MSLRSSNESSQLLCVRVWFGDVVLCRYLAPPTEAARYAALIAQRYAGLRLTIGPATDCPDHDPSSADPGTNNPSTNNPDNADTPNTTEHPSVGPTGSGCPDALPEEKLWPFTVK